mgnify:CR=1 FL=1
MNDLEKRTYCEPDFNIVDEFVTGNMSQEEKEKTIKETVQMYENFTDDDWESFANTF